jgi:hypothetical protein
MRRKGQGMRRNYKVIFPLRRRYFSFLATQPKAKTYRFHPWFRSKRGPITYLRILMFTAGLDCHSSLYQHGCAGLSLEPGVRRFTVEGKCSKTIGNIGKF